jgi:hypothetical protein
MKTKITLLSVISLFSFTLTSFTFPSSVNLANTKLIKLTQNKVKTICSYSFENVTDEIQIEKLKAEISLLKGVEEIKSVYKPEKKRGQITVIIIEPKRTSESQEMFDITQIKKAIINNGLSPLEVTISEEFID